MTNETKRPFFASGEDSAKAWLCIAICVGMVVTMCCSGCSAAGEGNTNALEVAPAFANDSPRPEDIAAAGGAQDDYPLVWWQHVSPGMRAAAARWTAATGLEIRFEDGGAQVYYLPMDQIQGFCETGAHGCISRSGRIALRADWIGTPNEEVTLMHEIGHMMLYPALADGGKHHEIPGVMHEWWTARDTGVALTRELLETVCAVRDCSRFVPETLL